jgi:hypothetical protein
MSASDAAPLPRLGEVFFDVRGSSRSMRLSWYSDTGVAVFSIWQGGTCTGTFRLPMDDLPRMVEALQRGPRGSGLHGADARDGTGPHDRTGLPSAPEPRTGSIQAVPYGDAGPAYGDDPLGMGGPAAPGGGYRPEPYRDRGAGLPEPSFQPSYPADPAPPGYRDSGPQAYRDGGPQPYRDDPLSDPLGPASGGPASGPAGSGYREDLSPGYRDAGPAYGDDPLGMGGPGGLGGPGGGYRPDLAPYQDAPYEPPYRDAGSDPRGRGYADDPFQSVYPEDARDRGYPDDPRSGSHPYGPPPPERDGRDGREQRAHRGRS